MSLPILFLVLTVDAVKSLHFQLRRIMNRYKISDDDFKKYVSESVSIRQVLVKMGHAPKGGNYKTIKNRIEKLNLSIKHFLGKAANKGQNFGPKRSIKDYLSNKFSIKSVSLKNRLINENLLKNECSNCKNTSWLENSIPLEIDHIDGNHENNNLNNLRLLCPNCHSLTPTFRRRKSSLKV